MSDLALYQSTFETKSPSGFNGIHAAFRAFNSTKVHEGRLMLKSVGMMRISFRGAVKKVQQGQIMWSRQILRQVRCVHQDGLRETNDETTTAVDCRLFRFDEAVDKPC